MIVVSYFFKKGDFLNKTNLNEGKNGNKRNTGDGTPPFKNLLNQNVVFHMAWIGSFYPSRQTSSAPAVVMGIKTKEPANVTGSFFGIG